MKKFAFRIWIYLAAASAVLLLANLEVTTKQGINYQVSIKKIPLYLKVLDFYDRHFNYKHLTETIVKSANGPEDKVIRILRWAHDNIRPTPEGLPTVDDHVWHIIVRGYGQRDQINDVFCTLCNYAGMDAFFNLIRTKDNKNKIVLSFVKINNKWYVFDPANGVYFVDNSGYLVEIEELRRQDNWQIKALGDQRQFDYAVFFENISVSKDTELFRSNIQSPLKRFIFAVHKLFGSVSHRPR